MRAGNDNTENRCRQGQSGGGKKEGNGENRLDQMEAERERRSVQQEGEDNLKLPN